MKALAAGLTALLVVAACSGDPEPSGDPSEAPGTSAEPTDFVAPADLRVVQLDVGPVGVTEVDGLPWTALPEDGSVRTEADRRIPVGEAPLRLVATPAGVWVSVIGDGTLVRIDPATGKVDLRRRLPPNGSEPEGLAYDGRRLWVVDQAGDRVVAMDPATGRVTAKVAVGSEPRLVSSGPSAVWVSNYGDGSVTRVRPDAVRSQTVQGCTTPQGWVRPPECCGSPAPTRAGWWAWTSTRSQRCRPSTGSTPPMRSSSTATPCSSSVRSVRRCGGSTLGPVRWCPRCRWTRSVRPART
ncbi:exported hypothetical protein [metagenome]|uniref:Uncharacterized protein n=1 Tax=metagenome TaxID=256318 RepID=A0A2P2BWB6_9ZZZZ